MSEKSTVEDAQDFSTNYVQSVLGACLAQSDSPMIVWRGDSYDGIDLYRAVISSRERLLERGVEPGDMVAVLTEASSPAALIARYAAHMLGAAVAHIRSTSPGSGSGVLAPSVQAKMISELGATVIAVDDCNRQIGDTLAEIFDGKLTVMPVGFEIGLDDTTGERADFSELVCPLNVISESVAAIAYTSGSTGQPKGVCHSFESWNRTVHLGFNILQQFGEVRFLSVTPTSHSVGIMLDMVIASRGQIVFHPSFTAGDVLRDIERFRITDGYVTVAQMYRMMDHPSIRDVDLSSLKRLRYAGCAASPERLVQAVETFGLRLIGAYGTSESGRIAALMPGDHSRRELLTTVGRPFPEVEIRICDPKSGAELKRGQVGEVSVSSPNMMIAYMGQPELTSDKLVGGWLRTGDLGRMDEDGYLTLVGRIGDVIKSRDTKVQPLVVENAILAHHEVADAAVYSMPDHDGLESVHAAVTLRQGAACGAEELTEHVRSMLPAQFVPVSIVFRDELPLTVRGKVDRELLREMELNV